MSKSSFTRKIRANQKVHGSYIESIVRISNETKKRK